MEKQISLWEELAVPIVVVGISLMMVYGCHSCTQSEEAKEKANVISEFTTEEIKANEKEELKRIALCREDSKKVKMLLSNKEECNYFQDRLTTCLREGNCGCNDERSYLEKCNAGPETEPSPSPNPETEPSPSPKPETEPSPSPKPEPQKKGMSTGEKVFLIWFLFL